ncbi:hypothetical protein ABD87_14980 [Lysinibacillus sphaericus]|uniref:hypothetical protein n=1 Tax=Lysinibacillus sphaericus TaxID=1421 RepID=UPI0018CD6C09|nr:hypothetical protein [Lysinibacillus sphaericus]MBG9730797.1 hypothetical protein [Lysinibacillus sphaericus]
MKKFLVICGIVVACFFIFVAIGNWFIKSDNKALEDTVNNALTKETKDSSLLEIKGNDEAVEAPTDKSENAKDKVNLYLTEEAKQTEKSSEEKGKAYKNDDGGCAIKGFTSDEGVKLAILPDNDFYDVMKEEVMFCTIQEAENKGYIDYGEELKGDNDARKQGVILDSKN